MRIAGVAYDWDLWPWLIAEGAGPEALAMLHLERAVRGTVLALGWLLLPVMRRLSVSMARFGRDLAKALPQ